MQHSLGKIVSKASDYKMCKMCETINWYENDNCHFCNNDITEHNTMSNEEMAKFEEREYSYYLEIEGFDEQDIDLIEINI